MLTHAEILLLKEQWQGALLNPHWSIGPNNKSPEMLLMEARGHTFIWQKSNIYKIKSSTVIGERWYLDYNTVFNDITLFLKISPKTYSTYLNENNHELTLLFQYRLAEYCDKSLYNSANTEREYHLED